MWAGGRVAARGPLRCGEPATRRTTVLAVTEKHGRSGHLTFVTVGVRVTQRGAVVVDEEQDIVYRDAASAAAPPCPPAAPAEVPAGPGEREIEVTPALLFRFSALIYNAHRIHYDRDYCRDVEGYPGLLTHGPLQALAMAEAVRAARETGRNTGGGPDGRFGGASFSYRLVSPLFDDQGLIASAAPGPDGTVVTAVRDRYGRQTAAGTFK
jgi:3-methylfumaryl-CoA hydratase